MNNINILFIILLFMIKNFRYSNSIYYGIYLFTLFSFYKKHDVFLKISKIHLLRLHL